MIAHSSIRNGNATRGIRAALLALCFLFLLFVRPAAAQTDDIECPAGQERNGLLCYPKCKAGYENIGLLCAKPCPEGFTNDGLTCRKDAHIFAKESYGRGAGSPMQCKPGEEGQAGLCYPACSAGYYGVGPVCWASCASGYTDHGATCYRNLFDFYFKRTYGRGVGSPVSACPAGTERDGLLCYPICRTGFKGVGPVCWQAECPAGYANDPATCRRDVQIVGREMYGRGVGTSPPSVAGMCRISYPTTFTDGTPRRLNEVTFLTAHNAFANTSDTWIHAQQTFSLETQLKGGVRALMLDIHKYGNDIKLCHGTCTGVAGSHYVEPRVSLSDELAPVKAFLDSNPREIVTIIFESYIADSAAVRKEFDKAGLLSYIYDPADDPDWNVSVKRLWPTLEWLIGKNRRLVVTTSQTGDTSTAIGPVFHYDIAVENTYDLGPTGRNLECSRRSESSPLDDKNKLFVLNHFRALSNLVAAGEDNGKDQIVTRINDKCLPVSGRLPNFITVDFYQHPYCGPAKAVMEMNAKWDENHSNFGYPADREFTLFDAPFYLALAPEVTAIYGASASVEAPGYWFTTGLSAGGSASTIFDPADYLNRYADLRQAFGATNYKAAVDHWINHGMGEGRQGSLFFDVRFYLNAYPDLQRAFGNDYLAAMRHWVHSGINEGRRGSAGFDSSYYFSAWPDLQNAFGNNPKRLMVHYLQFGRREGRRAVP